MSIEIVDPIDEIKYVWIKKSEYEELIKDSFKLQCLENGGVDNWQWYSESLTEWYKKYYPDMYC